MNKELKMYSFLPENFDQAYNFAGMIANSNLCPKDFKGKPDDIFIAMQMGSEVGLKPLQALKNIAVINGRPSVWGDAAIAIVRSHPACEYVTESFDESTMTAKCAVKRKGDLEQIRFFSQEDAQKAGLWTKSGPWTQYPKRMLQLRARGFALRDVFADALGGFEIAEEAQDMPAEERDITPPPEPAKTIMEALEVKPEAVVEEVEQPEVEPDQIDEPPPAPKKRGRKPNKKVQEELLKEPTTLAQITDSFQAAKSLEELVAAKDAAMSVVLTFEQKDRDILNDNYAFHAKRLKTPDETNN